MDDLLDLNWSSASNPPATSSPATLPPQPPRTSVKSPAAFDFLAQPAPSKPSTANYYYSSSSSSTPPLRPTSTTPNPILALPSRLNVPPTTAPSSGRSTPATSKQSPNPSSDAFSSLLSLPSGPSSSKALSLADRQRAMEEEQRRKAEHERQQFEAHGDFWDKLGGPSAAKLPQPNSNGLSDLLQPSLASSSSSSSKPVSRPGSAMSGAAQTNGGKRSAGSFWDEHDDLLASSSSVAPPSPPKRGSSNSRVKDPFDFDAFDDGLGPGQGLQAKPAMGTSGMRTPVSDFDFGDGPSTRSRREADRRRDGVEDEDDDLLGLLGGSVKPRERPRDTSPPSQSTHHARQPPSSSSRPASPPPHIVGQIVEMGFSPAQARSALARTATGLDVQAALDLLLGGSSQNGAHDTGPQEELSDDEVERERARRQAADAERRRRRRAGPSRDSVRTRDEPVNGGGATPAADFDADKLLAQASEIGQSVLTRAAGFWAASKERALKAYEEQQKKLQQQQQREDGEAKRSDGRPRWMVEQHEAGSDPETTPERGAASGGGFRDDDDDDGDAANSPPRPEPKPTSQNARQAGRIDANGGASGYVSTKDRADLLFAEEPIRAYKPANRHLKPSAPHARSPPRTVSPAPRPAAPLPSRKLVDASPAQIQASAAAKAKGNEHFKLGRFSEAETAYASAISQLPEGHLFLVPLYNNRAATRLKLGSSAAAAEDCTAAVDLIGLGYHPSKEAPLPVDVLKEVKLGEGLVKALLKRAQAWEMGEKWKQAVEDWERVLGLDSALLGSSASNTRSMASEGARRSRKMLDGDGSQKLAASAAPAIRRTAAVAARPPSRAADPDQSKAVSSLRQAARAADAEDEQRLALKDSVDAKVQAWKGGKEANLRALIASLDMVLWDEVMRGPPGMKVGMHELITEKQVKIRYMKVIGRLHPDKLDVKKTTVEQRMLANSAFGALNDAWQAFQGTS